MGVELHAKPRSGRWDQAPVADRLPGTIEVGTGMTEFAIYSVLTTKIVRDHTSNSRFSKYLLFEEIHRETSPIPMSIVLDRNRPGDVMVVVDLIDRQDFEQQMIFHYTADGKLYYTDGVRLEQEVPDDLAPMGVKAARNLLPLLARTMEKEALTRSLGSNVRLHTLRTLANAGEYLRPTEDIVGFLSSDSNTSLNVFGTRNLYTLHTTTARGKRETAIEVLNKQIGKTQTIYIDRKGNIDLSIGSRMPERNAREMLFYLFSLLNEAVRSPEARGLSFEEVGLYYDMQSALLTAITRLNPTSEWA